MIKCAFSLPKICTLILWRQRGKYIHEKKIDLLIEISDYQMIKLILKNFKLSI